MAGLRSSRAGGLWAGLRFLLAGVALGLFMPRSSAGETTSAAPAISRLLAASARGLGNAAIQKDDRLDAAARVLLTNFPNTDAISDEAVRATLWDQQLIEPVHRMMLIRYDQSSPEAMLTGLPAQLKVLLGTGHWQRFGVSTAPLAGAGPDGPDSRALIIVLESFIQLVPPPPAALGAAPTALSGALLSPYSHPKVVVTAPSGGSETPPLATHGREFSGPLRCAERGRYQVEVLGEDKRGPTVLANFPWYCGQAPPLLSAMVPQSADAVPWRDARDAERQILALLNRARTSAHLPALPVDEALSRVARAHCQDMAEHQFVGHVSPLTGSPGDRVHRAGITAPLITENLAQARSPQEADEGLLGSPGHRANILDPRVSRVGIGVQEIVGVAGIRQLVVTELFTGQLATVDVSTAPGRVVSTLQGLRKAAGRAALAVDAELNDLALRTAKGLVAGTITESHPDTLVAAALPSLRVRFAAVRAGVAVAQNPEQIAEVPALVDAAATHIGVAVAAQPAAKDGAAPLLYIVVMVARLATSG